MPEGPDARARPDSGLAGWFAARPDVVHAARARQGLYSDYGYAGYSYTTYDIGCCATTVMHPDYKFENTVANGEFMIATGDHRRLQRAAGAGLGPGRDVGLGRPAGGAGHQGRLREGLQRLRRRSRSRVVGLYLLWRSRQADMSAR